MEIAQHWSRRCQQQPHLFDGQVLLASHYNIHNNEAHLSFFQTSFSNFLAWKEWNCPDPSVYNAFSMAALKSRDGAFLLGRMAVHTAHRGQVYFPSGTPDLSDVSNGRVDLEASVIRELYEETGLEEASLNIQGWHLVIDNQSLAFMRPIHVPQDAAHLRQTILENLLMQDQPELDDIVIIHSKTNMLGLNMPGFVRRYVEHFLSSK